VDVGSGVGSGVAVGSGVDVSSGGVGSGVDVGSGSGVEVGSGGVGSGVVVGSGVDDNSSNSPSGFSSFPPRTRRAEGFAPEVFFFMRCEKRSLIQQATAENLPHRVAGLRMCFTE